MIKRATSKTKSINIQKLEQQLRGTEYRSYDYLMSKLDFELRTLQRYIDNLDPGKKRKMKKNNSDNLIQERIIKDKNGKAIKEFRIFDPAISTMPNFTKDEITNIWTNIFDNKSITLDPLIKNKLIKLISTKKVPSKYLTLIETFKTAIKKNNIVLVKEYYSRDFVLEKNEKIDPVYLDIDDRKVYARDMVKNNLRAYKFENMYGIELTNELGTPFEWKSGKENRDIFGFSSKGLKFNVHIEFDSFVRSQLIRQFPKLEEFVNRVGKSKNQFELKITVYDIAPIGRFIFGFISRIKILGNKDFKSALQGYYVEYIEIGIKNFIK